MRSFVSNHFIFFFKTQNNGNSLKEGTALDWALGGLGVLTSLLLVGRVTLDNPLSLSGFNGTRRGLRAPPDLTVCDYPLGEDNRRRKQYAESQ